MAVEFFDMAVSITPPNGHLEPVPLTLGPNWQPNDVRVLMVSAGARGGTGSATMAIPMRPDPPTGWSAAFDLAPQHETQGVFYRRLVAGDADTSVYWPKPPGWQYFFWTVLTVRGVSPAAAPTAGRFYLKYTANDIVAITDSLTVPTAGVVVMSIGSTNDVGLVGTTWPTWAVAMGVPSGWKHLVSTEKSGASFDSYDTNTNLMAVGKSYAASGTTGAVTVPVAIGQPAFSGLYAFFPAALGQSITVGAA